MYFSYVLKFNSYITNGYYAIYKSKGWLLTISLFLSLKNIAKNTDHLDQAR
jgi:hypothetical protein